MQRLATLTLLVGMLFATAGCDMFSTTSEQGHLKLYLTDNPFPFDLVDEANVTITRVDIVGADGIFTLVDEEQEYNLLDLRDGVTALMSESDLPAGIYSQIRLYVEQAEIVLNDHGNTTFNLDIPSGVQTGIKVVLPGFRIEADEVTELTLDFDVEQSFIALGNTETHAGINGFIFQPVIIPLGLD